ncbi:hypothetical protein [Halocynthiibacter namhaensis]|uniref:hypothetical protein n=1 Tax=Halocynthiibacter namhaensis TaxID=1290553 RepID=UPI0006907453|nr:hypothetical protein [Halocynthiibacter namhaensis]
MTDKTEIASITDEAFLDDLFQSARSVDLDDAQNDGFMARMMADAFDAQDDLLAVPETTAASELAPRRSWLRAFSDAIGGWPSFAGMAVATLAGIWIGMTPPAGLTDLAPLALADTESTALVEAFGFATGFDSLQEEG